MSDESSEAPEQHDPPDGVELIRDGENLLVVGDSKRAVESFMRSIGALEGARKITSRQLAPMLRSVADLTHAVADAVSESGLWVKLTGESAEAIKEFGLTDTEVPGVAYAMAGRPGDIKQWLKISKSPGAKMSSPTVLSGIAGSLGQAATQLEADQMRALIESLDEKIDQVLRGQRDAIVGPLNGVQRHIRSAQTSRRVQGEVDSQEWDKIAGTPQRIRELQSTAVEKLRGVAGDMEQYKRVGDLNARMPELQDQIELWIGVIARCFAALDEVADLELEYTAAIAPVKLDAKRLAIQEDRLGAITDLSAGVAELVSQMSVSAERAKSNRLLHRTGSPQVIRLIEGARDPIKKLYDALGLEINWESITEAQWREAIRQLGQWKNALAEGGSISWEKGKPVLKSLAMAGAVALVTALFNGKGPTSTQHNSQV